MRKAICAVAGLVVLTAATLGAQTHRPMTADDGLDMVRVRGALMSPDGEWVFFSKSELDWSENERKTTYYMVSADGGEPFQYIGEEGGSAFRFSPKGTYLSFRRTVDKKSQIFVMRTAGGEAVKLTDHESSIGSYQWTSDENTIYFVADEKRSEDDQKEYDKGADAVFIDEGPNGQREGSWSNLWKLDVATKEITRLTEEEHRIGSIDVSPDGGRILYTARSENRRNQNNLSEIYMLHVASNVVKQLTPNHAPEGGIRWSPDGMHFAYNAPSDSEWDLRLAKIWVMNVNTGTSRMVSGEYSGNISTYQWTPDGKSLLFTGLQRTNSNLYQLDVESGKVKQLTQVEGSVSSASYSADRKRMVYTYQDFDTPPDLYTSPTESYRPTRLTDANPWIASEIATARGEVVQWTSKDGTEIEGLLMLPEGHDRSSPAPLLLHIHGGPAGVFTNSFRASTHVWAGLGYAQLMPNVRGSSGYTDELLRGNMQDIGGGDYWDLMTGVDWAIEQGIADPDSLALRGWSYGGILGGWTITQTDRFKAASVGAMVSDWTSEYGPGFNYDVSLWYIGGKPWENPEDWRQKSSLTHIANVTTPTIILHGANDRTDTEQQSMMFFAALKDRGVEVRYLQFPREPHGFREPRHQRIRDIEEIRWIQKYVRGVEWEPWERKKEEDEKKKEKVVTE